jgi:hypothetical protein
MRFIQPDGVAPQLAWDILYYLDCISALKDMLAEFE